jgi:hypothetical protein
MNPQDLLTGLITAYETHGLAGAVGVGLSLVLQIYKEPAVQALVPDKLKWTGLSALTRGLVAFGLSATGGALAAVASGGAVLTIVVSAIVAGLSALGYHLGSKQVGKLAIVGESPGVVARLASIAVPIPSIEQLKEARRAAQVKP